jgi:hypothetical protein
VKAFIRFRKWYLSVFFAILGLSTMVALYGRHQSSMQRARPVLKMIHEGTPKSMLTAERLLNGVEFVNGRRMLKETHRPLKGVGARNVKRALLSLLERSEDQTVVMRVLSIFALVPSTRSGFILETDEEWHIVERVANDYNESQNKGSPSVHRYFRIRHDTCGNKALSFGSGPPGSSAIISEVRD